MKTFTATPADIEKKWILIDAEGVVGDAILDRRHHGGPDQAIYVYLQDDYDLWSSELGETLAQLGETFRRNGFGLRHEKASRQSGQRKQARGNLARTQRAGRTAANGVFHGKGSRCGGPCPTVDGQASTQCDVSPHCAPESYAASPPVKP